MLSVRGQHGNTHVEVYLFIGVQEIRGLLLKTTSFRSPHGRGDEYPIFDIFRGVLRAVSLSNIVVTVWDG